MHYNTFSWPVGRLECLRAAMNRQHTADGLKKSLSNVCALSILDTFNRYQDCSPNCTARPGALLFKAVNKALFYLIKYSV